jgi:hypothetical protein
MPYLKNVAVSSEVAAAPDTELALACESPAVIPLDLGAAEDGSPAEALAATDALPEV